MRDDEYGPEEDGGGNLFAHLPTILKERYLLIIIPAIICSIAGVAAAFMLPTVYRSTATMLVESPQLPEDVLGAGSVDVVDQRIAKFRQQVLSRPRLIELIQKHRLYADERSKTSLSEIISEMRAATKIEAVSAEVQRSVAGRSSTIAFSLSFDYKSAPQAQAVAQDMTEQVLLLDATQNSEQAESTVRFLADQATALQTQISDAENRIETIKAQNGLALSNPGMMAMGGPNGAFDVQIIALQRDNALLKAQREAQLTAAQRDPIVASAEAALAAAQARYADGHPDIAIAKRQVAEALRLAASNQAKRPADTIDQQIAANNAQIQALQTMRAQELARLSSAQSAMARAPLIEQQIAQEQQRLSLLTEQYEAVSSRLMQAQGSAKAESEQKGERLSIIDPPIVPDEPTSPNRPLLMAAGLLGGIGLGFLLALAAELVFRPIRDMDDIRSVTGAMPLVSIPTIPAGHDPKAGRLGAWRLAWPGRRRRWRD
ncbi:MAG: lipopolysaccharide biosynthesis protein [Alphaproteobacteria bacterium HGW-Alphaproteobacteria-9]|nr:MAG: lipopolysaccharide biosynthesis protein [Alphaproteobacteria bacterium HGW-Alphaproteobacteria-9]